MFATKGVIYARPIEISMLLEKGLANGPLETKTFAKGNLLWRSNGKRVLRAAEKFAREKDYDIIVPRKTQLHISSEIWEVEYDFYTSPDRY